MTRSLLRRAVLACLAAPALFLGWVVAVWPPPVWYRTHWPAHTAFMTMRGGDPARRRYHPVPLDAMARPLREAATTGEDARFWSHAGLDYVEIRHALGYRRAAFAWSSERDRKELWRVLGRTWDRRDALRGASTITQQVAKNLYLSPTRNPLRKLKEAVTAKRLEWALGKPRILELYLNIAELGDGIWGVEAASQRYFRTSARRLSDTQAAALAATLPFPLRSNPAFRPNRMRRRQDLILRRLHGEPIEIPKVEDEPVMQPGDTIQWTPGIDSLLDSLRAPVETLPPGIPADSAGGAAGAGDTTSADTTRADTTRADTAAPGTSSPNTSIEPAPVPETMAPEPTGADAR